MNGSWVPEICKEQMPIVHTICGRAICSMITSTNREGIGQRLVLNLPGSPRAAYHLNQNKPTPALVHFWKTDFHLDCRNEVREDFTIRILYYTILYYTILYYAYKLSFIPKDNQPDMNFAWFAGTE